MSKTSRTHCIHPIKMYFTKVVCISEWSTSEIWLIPCTDNHKALPLEHKHCLVISAWKLMYYMALLLFDRVNLWHFVTTTAHHFHTKTASSHNFEHMYYHTPRISWVRVCQRLKWKHFFFSDGYLNSARAQHSRKLK